MNPADETATEFERNARQVLQASLLCIDGGTRSRLNQARQAAVQHASRAAGPGRFRVAFMPAAGAAAAALLIAVLLGHRAPIAVGPAADGQPPAVEDMELLADGEALELVEGGDGLFYEWAAEQPDASAASPG